MQTSTQFYLTHFLTEEPNEHAKNGDASHDTCEEDHGVPAGGRRCGRQMEVLDPASFTRWNQTLRRTPAAPARGQPPDAHDPVAGVRTDGLPSSAGLCPGAPEGGVLAHGTGMELRAALAPDGDLGEVVWRADRPAVRLAREPGRPMEVLDLVSFAQRTQTLQRSAATPSPGHPANAYPPIAAVRADGGASPADLGARPPQGRIHPFGTRTEVSAAASSNVWVGKVVIPAGRPGG